MGIPKFFRWISERYPLTSQLITPNSIPTFDNLYLDMNGIIHNCSHPPSTENDPHVRISEEQMVLAIFAYIDHLFTKIKPRKVFFMAVDGVAPRAKMNQQRSRRFRTAKEAQENREKAERKGEKLPDEKAFDSNCITPGTPFMARLSKHLEYFVNKKISEDADWRGVKVILSGHNVPGEGEHKIQEFIRLSKAQPDYNPNTRHCLYGLDADLIMLGLLSHDPHFCLLREEVTFGRQRKNQRGGLAQQNFFLLHLSLLREYLDLEFSTIADELPFEYDLEKIIDDFILLSVFVGNDFLPHLPNIHINEGAMELIWGIYRKTLPTAGGYINNAGQIDLKRLQSVLDQLSQAEFEMFEREYADLNWYKGKQQKEIAAMEAAKKRGKLIMTKAQRELLDKIQTWVEADVLGKSANANLALVNNFPARDRRFIQELGDALHLDVAWDEYDEQDRSVVTLRPSAEGTITPQEDTSSSDEEEEEEDESAAAIARVFGKYRKAKVVENDTEDFESSYEAKLREKLNDWKKDYYKEKLEFNKPEETQELVFKYVEGLQWVMNYYYQGVASWGWFYPYHYAPRISDLVGLPDMKFDFELGEPFQPFQQLMGVLPAASSEHIPPAYRDLMTDPESPIVDFYPKDFVADMNGKKQEWEAIVKIPFIDEKRLLKAMATRENRLTAEEKQRNLSGQLSTMFVFDEEAASHYPSSLPGSFPDLTKNLCRMDPFELPILHEGMAFKHGLLEGTQLGASALAGFPSTKTLPHHAQLGYHGVNVHGQDSKNPSMVISIENSFEGVGAEDIAKKLVGQRTFIYWPFLQEALVVGVSDERNQYNKHRNAIVGTPHDHSFLIAWKKKADRIEGHYSKRFGVLTGNIDVLLHVRPLRGLKRMDDGSLIKDYEDADKETEQAVQMAVHHVVVEDERYLEQSAPPLKEEFPVGSKVIFLGDHAYGVAAQVAGVGDNALAVNLAFFPDERAENERYRQVVRTRQTERYYPSFVLARQLGISSLALSRITSTMLVEHKDGKSNIGLSLKFESKGQKVLGYSRKNDRGWEYSEATYRLVEKYLAAYPEVFATLDGSDRGVAKAWEMFRNEADPDAKLKEIRNWLKEQGVLDLEPVTLFAEELERNTVTQLEKLADDFNSHRKLEDIKRILVRRIPRQAILKPAHAEFRLQGQVFSLGDRVVMAQDSAVGGVPLSMKGVVIGLNTTSIDVVWDSPFIGGGNLSGRCSEQRGSTVPFSSCLNLSRPQFAVHTGSAPKPVGDNPAFKPRIGPAPVVAGQHFRPAHQTASVLNRPSQPLATMPRGGAPPKHHQPGQGQYGNAAKGTMPAAPTWQQQQQFIPHQQVLASALNRGGAPAVRGHANGHGHAARGGGHALLQQLQRPPASSSGGGGPAAAPPNANNGFFDAAAAQNGHGHAQNGHGHGGQQPPTRGRGAPRGRGAHRGGRGGHPKKPMTSAKE